MRLLRPRTLQGRIFAALLVVVLVPALAALGAAMISLQSIGEGSGTLGAWDAVAESGRDLLAAIDSTRDADPALLAAAERHRQALSESVRLSRVYTFVAERALAVLPVAALFALALIVGLALLAARLLARGLSRPVSELVTWTELVARGEPLPAPASAPGNEVHEVRALRAALRRMAGELEEGRRQAVEAARMRSWTELARRVAHEIKNPLTSMQMAAATVARARGEGPGADAAAILQDEIRRLDDMARTFSQFGRMPDGPRSPVDVGELLTHVARASRHPNVAITVDAAPGLVVEAHYEALRRAIENLVLNAEESMGSEGGAIQLTAASGDGGVRVEVADTGPGFPEAFLDDVWRPDVTTKRHGTGLGLAIVRQTVAYHGGRSEAYNRAEGGAVVSLFLPHAPPEPS